MYQIWNVTHLSQSIEQIYVAIKLKLENIKAKYKVQKTAWFSKIFNSINTGSDSKTYSISNSR